MGNSFKKVLYESVTSVKKETVFEGDFEDIDERFGAESGKIGSEDVKIKFEARQKRQEFC